MAKSERSISLRGWEVQALLRGATQLRRVIPDIPGDCISITPCKGVPECWYIDCRESECGDIGAPYAVGERVWCKETWRESGNNMMADGSIPKTNICVSGQGAVYRADADWDGPWRSATQMPRWASRLSVEFTSVRCERLQQITEEDARACGGDNKCSRCFESANSIFHDFIGSPRRPAITGSHAFISRSREDFIGLWDSTARKGEEWDANLWTWVYGVRVCK